MAAGTLEQVAPRSGAWEAQYTAARTDTRHLTWHHDGACPALVAWLNAEAPSLVRPGGRGVVVGCGLGDDVAEVASRGYDAFGLDCSRTAVEWARQRHPDLADSFFVGDAITPPGSMRGRYDLVVDVNTLGWEPADAREAMARGMAAFLRPHGTLVSVTRITPETGAFTAKALTEAMTGAGLSACRGVDEFEDGPSRWVRAAFKRA